MRKTVTVAKFHLGLGEPLGLSTETTTASTSPTLMLNTSRNDPKELTTSEHMMSESEVAARFENRRDILQTACQRYANSSAFRKMRMRTVPLSLYHPVFEYHGVVLSDSENLIDDVEETFQIYPRKDEDV